MFIYKDSLRLLPANSGDAAEFYLCFSFTSMHPCVITVYQGHFERVTGIQRSDPTWHPGSEPIQIKFVPLQKSPFE